MLTLSIAEYSLSHFLNTVLAWRLWLLILAFIPSNNSYPIKHPLILSKWSFTQDGDTSASADPWLSLKKCRGTNFPLI